MINAEKTETADNDFIAVSSSACNSIIVGSSNCIQSNLIVIRQTRVEDLDLEVLQIASLVSSYEQHFGVFQWSAL